MLYQQKIFLKLFNTNDNDTEERLTPNTKNGTFINFLTETGYVSTNND